MSLFGSWAVDSFYRGFSADPLLASFYGDSGYANLGYWDDTTKTPVEACDRLVDRLVEMIGEVRGTVLDVACGWGGTTRRLCAHFGPGNVSAMNVSPQQLAAAAERVPEARFHCMDATSMAFAAQSFESIVCVEAAFHFDTRREFLVEAFRVLKPGGVIVLSDLLVVRGTPTVPLANYVPDAAAYSAELAAVGFRSVQVEPARRRSLDSFRLSFSEHLTANRTTTSWFTFARDLFFTNVTMPRLITEVLLVSARKPC